MSAANMPPPPMKFTSADLLLMPDDGKRYEVIEGELYVAKQPNWHHQYACTRLLWALEEWNNRTRLGVANLAPGLIFAEDDDVAPDVVWISNELLPKILGADGKLHAAPELVVEVLSPGWNNQHRDRQAKLKLYSRRGVLEYWLVDWEKPSVEIYRRENEQLVQTSTLLRNDALTSPLLPGFACSVSDLIHRIPLEPQS
ncbi:MAG TPA: Uma2 family endonuclease [Blastocatellia bacterium]|nr:Uma2 family endonuclease [Blastocatellia bacterium]